MLLLSSFLIIFFLFPFTLLWLSNYLDKKTLNKEIQGCIGIYEDIVALQTQMNMPIYGANIFNVQIKQVRESSMTICYLKGYLQRYRALLLDKQAELQSKI